MPAEAAKGPALELPATTNRAGILNKGAAADGEFVLRNTGDAPLELSISSISCACLTAEVDALVAPGKEGKLRYHIETLEISGPVEISILLATNDPQRAQVTLKVQAISDPPLAADPGYARYIYVQGEMAGTITQQVFAVRGDDFSILKVESPYAFIATDFREAAPGERRANVKGRQWIVKTTIDPKAQVGALVGSIKVHTNLSTQRVLEIPLSGFVRPVLSIDPQRGDFGRLAIGKASTAVARITAFSTEPVAILRAESDSPRFKAEVVELQEGRRYKLRVTADSTEAGQFSGVVTVFTSSPKLPRLELPVTATFEAPR